MRLLGSLNRSPRKLLAAMGILTCATALAVGSGANFNSSSYSPGSLVSAGIVAQSNSKSAQAVLDVPAMAPGTSQAGTLDIRNTGDINSSLTLTKSNLVNTPASPPFSSKLTLVIADLGDPACVTGCPAAVTKYSGTVGAMGALALGVFAANAVHRYRFTVTYPDGGPNGADNAYNGARTTVEYDWESSS
jgi:spore coat-associated protein N